MTSKIAMADPAEVLDALDFKTDPILCDARSCANAATRLVGCRKPGCLSPWKPACSAHSLVSTSSSIVALCTGCQSHGPVYLILTSRPL